jgi:uncharacterized Ntn-hydrolase superfamily protein
MTFSIIARCTRTGQFGLAATTALPAVGKFLTHASPRAGAIATQAKLNPYLGIAGIRLLKTGMSAAEVIAALSNTDPRMDRRQLGVIDRDGKSAMWTGKGCKGWAGGEALDNLCVLGNRLEGPEVISAAIKAFNHMPHASLVDRLAEALAAGTAAGGDRKEERSSTIYVVETEEYPLWDIRVDDHDDPIGELFRLKDVFARQLLPHIARMATRANPAGIFGDDED